MIKAILFVGFLTVVGLVGSYESSYSRDAVCESFNDGVYTFIDESGNEWAWEAESEEFTIGAMYTLSMDDNHTSNIKDDWIKKPLDIQK